MFRPGGWATLADVKRAVTVLALSSLPLSACSTATQTRPTEVEESVAPTTAAVAPSDEAPATTPAQEGAAVTEPPEAATEEAAATAAPPGAVDGEVAVPDPGVTAAALALAPEDADWVTLTDWSAIKRRLGAEDLTSESIQTDRIEFWRGVEAGTVLLTDGALRAENSRLGIRYATTQDDVRWEVRWTGEGDDEAGSGLALRMRPELDLEGLQRAVADEVDGLQGARVLPEEHLLLRGEGEPFATLGSRPEVAAALADAAESQLAVPGCLSWPTALGVDATIEDQEALTEAVDVAALLDPAAWGIAFTGRAAEVTIVYPEGTEVAAASADAVSRLDLAETWPTTEEVGWSDAFGLPPDLTAAGYEVTDRGGRTVATLDYRVVNPTAAATVALAGLVPLAVCSEIDWLAEPTGL